MEGTTDSSVFYGVGDRISIGSIEAAGISIVPVGSKTSILLAHAILTAIGIPVYALFDADGGFKARAIAKGKQPKEIDEERHGHVKANRATLRYFGLPEEDFPSAIVSQKVAIFEDHLEALMAANWPEWVTACNKVASAEGIKLTKNQFAYRTATLRAEGAVPDMLTRILANAKGGSDD